MVDPNIAQTENGGGSRDYEDVEQAARQLGGRGGLPGAPDSVVQPVEESEDVAAAVDADAPVPELTPPGSPGPVEASGESEAPEPPGAGSDDDRISADG